MVSSVRISHAQVHQIKSTRLGAFLFGQEIKGDLRMEKIANYNNFSKLKRKIIKKIYLNA